MKRSVAICMLIALMAIPALAPAETFVIEDPEKYLGSFQVTTFEHSVPEDLQAALDDMGLEGRAGYCGALVDFLPDLEFLAMLPQESPEKASYRMALLAVEDESGGKTLVGMMQKSANAPWEITLANPGVLFPDRDFFITFTFDSAQLGDYFEIVYPRQGGGTERYGVKTASYNDKTWPWFIQTYASVDDAGKGYAIDKARGIIHGFQVSDMPRSADFEEYYKEDKQYSVFLPFWLDYLGGLQSYPTTEAEIKALPPGSWDTFLGQAPATTLGCNLRAKPTTSSRALGMYNGGVRLTIADYIPKGAFGWYQVRVGEREGYMSANYVYEYGDTHFQAQLEYPPLPVVRTISAQALLQAPGGKETEQLPANTYGQVLAETSDGWLHVSIPQEGVRWQMDPNAPTGYLRKKDVVTLSLAEHALVGQP